MMVEAGGNIGLGDPPPDKPGWRIGIARPTPKARRASISIFPARRFPLPAIYGSTSRSAASAIRT